MEQGHLERKIGKENVAPPPRAAIFFFATAEAAVLHKKQLCNFPALNLALNGCPFRNAGVNRMARLMAYPQCRAIYHF